ncbi:uncharacterized protein LOC105198147 [Solenopsis invicta]|uniref:uncharacterized protein LOC105198147 n=1 Tax=Solenopsis invicta TaxID=13686 RepID=UPI00193DB1DD|nr:uncharacterized protein LOC105198147 [Solenopsis invicta]
MANLPPWPGTSDNLAWHFFTPESWPIAKCNLCNITYCSGRTEILETHLWEEHPETIKKIQEEILPAWLPQYFAFDVKDCETKCLIKDCSINVFDGINHLKNHLLTEHNINEPTDNENITTDDHAERPQAAEHQNRRTQNFDNLIWRYFTEEWPISKCNICNNNFRDAEIKKLERHLRLVHPKIIKEIRDEIESSWLSPYFVYDNRSKMRCVIGNCDESINIFFGVNYLSNHLLTKHNIGTETPIAQYQGNTSNDDQTLDESSQDDQTEKPKVVQL